VRPQYLVDGITKRSEWDTLMKQVASVSDEIGHDVKARDKDLERLNFIHDASPERASPRTSMMRLLRDYNFIRVMNQVGFAQIADARWHPRAGRLPRSHRRHALTALSVAQREDRTGQRRAGP
jgi:hypothetical protein